MIIGKTFYCRDAADAWSQALIMLGTLANQPRENLLGNVVSEVLGVTFVIEDPQRWLITSPGRKFNYRTIVAESLWNLSPRDDIAFLARYYPAITQYVSDQHDDDQEFATWAYGPQVGEQVFRAFQELHRDPLSRRARVTLRNPETRQGTPPCLSSVQWFVRKGLLHQIVNMRSNDVWLGLPLDIGQFSLWHQIMAAALGLPLGTYVHHDGSLHLYERDYNGCVKVVQTGTRAHYAPGVQGRKALDEALSGNVLGFADEFGPDEMPAPAPSFYHLVEGLKPYAALLAGVYADADAFKRLKEAGEGRGW